MEKVLEGIIIKGIGGFYYVEAAGEVFECKARGAFRKKKITPLAGDNVTITVRQDRENTIDEIHERKNFLLRPPVANIDTLIIVSSVKEPVPSLLVIDKLTAIAVDKGIKPCVVFSKSDLGDTNELEAVYKKAGIDVASVCCKTGDGIEKGKEMIGDGITVFTGNTDVMPVMLFVDGQPVPPGEPAVYGFVTADEVKLSEIALVFSDDAWTAITSGTYSMEVLFSSYLG